MDTKRSKECRQEVNNSNEEDRISQLPDSILLRILSQPLMRTREVVKTMVLSKRWQNLWTSTPCLFLDNYEDDLLGEESFPDFEQFVNTVLLLRDVSDIHTFRLWWGNEGFDIDSEHHLNTWAWYAVRHNVKVFDIDIDLAGEVWNARFELPRCIFNCKSLEKLRLKFCPTIVELSPPEFVGLGRLRKLSLSAMVVKGSSLKKVLEGCPVLEGLQLSDCDLVDPDISSHTLRKLDIGNCGITGTMIRISGPRLQTLWFSHNDIEKVPVLLENLSSLVDAMIQIDDHIGHRYSCRIDDLSGNHLKFVSSGDKCTADNELPEGIGLPAFRDLRKLRLIGTNMIGHFQTVANFLELSPKLEQLTLDKFLACGSRWAESYDCPHIKMLIEYQCSEETEEVSKLVNEFFDSKCDCRED